MSNLPANLAKLLRAAGLEVIEIDNWQTRGRPASTGGFSPVGVLNHHTGSSAKSKTRAARLAYAKWMFLTGRSDLPAPLCHLSLGPDGEVYLGAAGRANHAGKAKASGSVSAGDGNKLYIGIEWMLSGTESIPSKMYEAGVTLNAVLTEEITKTSVQTISCHYNTSVTGKWDIGDPSGIAFNGAKVLDVPKFRKAVNARRKELYMTKPVKSGIRIRVGHVSMQYSDSPAQMKSDVERVFEIALRRQYRWIAGTEAGPGADPMRRLLRTAAKKYGFSFYQPKGTDGWICVRKSRIKGRVKKSYKKVIPSSASLYRKMGTPEVKTPRWGAKGVISCTFKTIDIGTVSIATSHYLTKSRHPNATYKGINHWAWNRRLAKAIGQWAEKAGKGSALAFYSGDQNMNDKKNDEPQGDTFFGEPLTSCWDELEKWPNTGHGTIDVIASYNGDRRVKCVAATAYNDKSYPLNTDHYLIEATYEVALQKESA